MALAPALRALLDRPESARRIGPFRLVRQLGRGGFAPVWLARETFGEVELRDAAVKLFAPDAGPGNPKKKPPSDSEARVRRERVVEEARLLCLLDHPNIVRYYRLVSDDDSGVMGLVMEHVEGSSLERRIANEGKLPLSDVLAAGAAVASALSAVHRAGLVHRDVKPANIVEAHGNTKLIDFGIASFAGMRSRPPPRSQAGTDKRLRVPDLPVDVLGTGMDILVSSAQYDDGTKPEESDIALPSGTIGYIDPVCVAQGLPATAASDLYSLGATLFECITGKLPSVAAAPRGGMKGEVLDGRAEAPRLLAVDPSAPAALARLIDALLDPKREKRPASAERVAVELEKLQRERAGRARTLPAEDVGPFRGLGRFEQSDRDVFFGRSAEVAAALERLRSRGLCALVGESGSGKSSLVRAGVAPAVVEGGLAGSVFFLKAWDVRVAVPGADARASIGGALSDLVPGASQLAPDALATALGARADAEGRGTLLVVDQLEELVTMGPDTPSTAWAAGLLARMAEPVTPGVRAIVAARRDLLDPLLALPGFGRALPRGLLLIAPMSEEAWGDVIDQGLEAYGYAFEDAELRESLMAELRAARAPMPLVQFALSELWEQRDRERKTITRAGLRAIGGIAGALERYADATLERITSGPKALPVGLVREVLVAMTTAQGTRSTRTAEELGRLAGPEARVAVAELEAARLVVRQESGLTLAHETLLSQWGTLRRWLTDVREARLRGEEIERDAARFAGERDESLLWKGRRLLAAEDLVRSGLAKLSPEAEGFVRQGRAVERRRKVVATGLIGVAVLALGGGVMKYAEAVRAAELATTRAELAEARKEIEAAKLDEQLAELNERRAKERQEAAARQQQATEEERKREVALKEKHKAELDDLTKRIGEAKTKKELEAIQREIKLKLSAEPKGSNSKGEKVTKPTVIERIGDPP